MKKLLMFFTVAMTTGCTIVDYNCNWDYKIDNQTGADIVVEVERRDAVYESTTIEVGDTQIFYNGNGHCGSGGVPQNIYPPEESIFDASFTYLEYIKINGDLIPYNNFKSKYWNFVSTGRHHTNITYTLTLTDELLEELRQQDESSN